MFLFVIVSIIVVSVLLAVWSVWKQSKLHELIKVKKDLKQKRVIYQREN